MPTVYGVRGIWSAGLSIDGKSVPIWPNRIKSLSVKSGMHRNLPTFEVSIDDVGAEILENYNVNDGAKVEIVLGDGSNNNGYQGRFSIIGGPKAVINQHGVALEFHGTIDAVPWMRKVADTYTKGTSGDVIRKLAGQAGLGAEVDPTKDFMTWLPNRKPIAKYARFVAQRGYAGASSCMLLGVNDKGTVLYKNLQNIIGGAAGGLTLGRGGIPVLQWQVASKADVYNSSGAYGSTTIGENMDGKLYSLNKVVGTQVSRALGFSSAIADGLGQIGTRLTHMPINPGNVYKEYVQALHQNMRIKSAFSCDVHLLVGEVSNVELMKMIQYQAINPLSGEAMSKFSGGYIVSNIVKTFTRGRYFEKITGTSDGFGS